jgi:hypothetical protein
VTTRCWPSIWSKTLTYESFVTMTPRRRMGLPSGVPYGSGVKPLGFSNSRT